MREATAFLRGAFAVFLLACLISGLDAHRAAAQHDDGLDRSFRDRGASADGKDFTLKLTLPLFYSTSVLAANSDGTTIDKPDTHFFPDLELKWAHQYDLFRLSAYGAVGSDRYFELSSAEVGVIEGGFTAELTDGKSDLFTPYVSYIGRTYLDGNFRSLHDQRHDLALGAFSGVGFRNGEIIRYADATQAGDQSLGIDVQGGHRIANLVHREHTFATVSVDYTYTFQKEFWVVLSPKIRVRWYDDFFDEFRRDVRLSVAVKAVWEPDWLTQIMPHTQLILGAEYFNNSSTDEFSKYSLWEFGPTLRVTTKF